MLSFKLGNSRKNLLVPCTEYFIRAYARNIEVCRALTTLRWSDVMSVVFSLGGSSQPEGEEIEWLTRKFDGSDGKEGGHLVLPRPVRTAEAEEFLNEHSHMAPDGHSETIIVKPPPFKLLGPKRPIKKKKEVIKTDRGRLGPNPPEADSHSSGEGTGAGKSVGKLEHFALMGKD